MLLLVSQTSNIITFTNASYNGNVTSQVWTFPGGSPSSSTAASPAVTYSSAGSYPVTLKVYSGSDSVSVTRNNFITVLPNTGNPYPFSESFESTSLNGPAWFSNSLDPVNNWEITTDAAVTGTHSIMLDNFNNTMMTKDELYSPVIDLSGSPNISFTFKYAFARKDTVSQDQLQVYITKTCTGTYVPRISLIGSALETVAPQISSYVPSGPGDWRQVNVNVPAIYCTPNFRFKFVFTSKGGNNIYIDDINIESSTGIKEFSEQVSEITLYPNPAGNELTVTFNLNATKTLNFVVSNVIGQTIIESEKNIFNKGENKISLDLKTLKNGLYFIKLNDGKQEITKRFVVSK
jgi:PKD repeat protein